MKIFNKKVLIAVVVLLLVGGGVYYFLIRDDNTNAPQVQEIPADEESQDNMPDSTEAPTEDESQNGEDAVKPEIAEQRTGNASQVTLSSIEQEGSKIVAKAYAEAESKGNCELKMTKGSQQVVKTSKSTLQTSYYQCDGFEFSVNEVPSSGKWTVAVTYIDSSGNRSESNIMNLEVNK